MPKLRTLARKYGAKLSVATAAATCSVLALAQTADPATPIEAVRSLGSENSAYGPVFWGLAAVSTGIMIGVMWIKRGKRAA